MSRFHETGGLPLFWSCSDNSLLPRVFLSVAIQLEVEDQAGSKRRAGDPAPRKDCGPCVRVVSVFHHPHISTPSFRLVRHASKHLGASEQAAFVISCTQKFNLKRILQQRRGHVTAQRINESQDVRSNSNTVAKYRKEVSSNL